MPKLVITLDDDEQEILKGAAKYEGLPISLWAKHLLLKGGRAIKHRLLCTPKSMGGSDGITYQWAGHPCTKKEYEAGVKQLAKERALFKEQNGYDALPDGEAQ